MSLEDALAKLAKLLAQPAQSSTSPLLVMVAGSNGAGKSTFYEDLTDSLLIAEYLVESEYPLGRIEKTLSLILHPSVVVFQPIYPGLSLRA